MDEFHYVAKEMETVKKFSRIHIHIQSKRRTISSKNVLNFDQRKIVNLIIVVYTVPNPTLDKPVNNF